MPPRTNDPVFQKLIDDKLAKLMKSARNNHYLAALTAPDKERKHTNALAAFGAMDQLLDLGAEDPEYKDDDDDDDDDANGKVDRGFKRARETAATLTAALEATGRARVETLIAGHLPVAPAAVADDGDRLKLLTKSALGEGGKSGRSGGSGGSSRGGGGARSTAPNPFEEDGTPTESSTSSSSASSESDDSTSDEDWSDSEERAAAKKKKHRSLAARYASSLRRTADKQKRLARKQATKTLKAMGAVRGHPHAVVMTAPVAAVARDFARLGVAGIADVEFAISSTFLRQLAATALTILHSAECAELRMLLNQDNVPVDRRWYGQARAAIILYAQMAYIMARVRDYGGVMPGAQAMADIEAQAQVYAQHLDRGPANDLHAAGATALTRTAAERAQTRAVVAAAAAGILPTPAAHVLAGGGAQVAPAAAPYLQALLPPPAAPARRERTWPPAPAHQPPAPAHQPPAPAPQPPAERGAIRCYKCKELGHRRVDCPNAGKK